MSLALADFLIELSDPRKLQAYRRDPEAAMKGAGLSEAEKKALRSEDVRHIQLESQYPMEAGNWPDGMGPVAAILNGVITLPPVVIVWAPPRWTVGYRALGAT
jgi:hypothetical protein